MKKFVSKMKKGSNGRCVYLGLLFLVALSLLAGCSGGDDGQPGSSSDTLFGTVTNSLTGGGVAGATITTDPAIEGLEIKTDASGNYSASLPSGTYEVTCANTNFTTQTEKDVTLVATQTKTLNFNLVPTSAVVVTISGVPSSSVPGETFGLTATVESMDGSTVTGYSWTQTASAAATIQNGDTASPTITLGDEAAYRTELLKQLTVRNGDLYENLDRVMIQGSNPYALELAGQVTFQAEVTTTSGTYKGTADVHSTLAFANINPGIGRVPNGLPVLLSGKEQATYDWTLTAPSGSSATLNSGTIRNPTFTPDVGGTYTVNETVSGQSKDLVAANWIGAITGEDANGRPLSAACTACHNDSVAPDKFTDWRESGHAEIFTNNLNTSTHYGDGCFMCHTVGFDKSVSNNGFDDASDYAAFMDAGLLNNPSPNNWTTMLSKYPNAAKLANIQCENCHGPQGAPHPPLAIEKGEMSISSDVCATCHGEPKRHARFQQWKESNHGNFELAIGRGTSTSCSRCHTGQGFLVYVPRIEAGESGSLPSELITWTSETVQPQTCAACHDPHKQGTTSGEPNTATVRVEDNTPMLPAGFQANGVGRGAVCMVCHNTRNGAHNDTTGTTDDRAPHTAAQTDVIMGQNAYFVSLSATRSPHSLLTDTCATCHMEETPPPADLSYNLSGTNHAFSASITICKDCHGKFDGSTVQTATEALLHDLEKAIETAIANEITAQTTAGNTVTVTGDVAGTETTRVITDGSTVTNVVFTESHGRQAMDLTFTDGVTIAHIRLASDTVVSGGVDLTFLSSAAGQLIAKAGWNYFLIEGDGSKGVHNNRFTQKLLDSAIAAF